jgi:DNA-binding ferritin-like protein
MIKLAAHLRHMQLYTHNAHNMCKGDTFFTDHPELGGLYGTYEDAYDGVVERLIGLGKSPDLLQVQKDAVAMLDSAGTPSGFNEAFSTILGYEEELCKLVDAANEGASLGTQNFVQGIADTSEVRQYKLKQRLSKSSAKAEDSNEEEKEAVYSGYQAPQLGTGLLSPTPQVSPARLISDSTGSWGPGINNAVPMPFSPPALQPQQASPAPTPASPQVPAGMTINSQPTLLSGNPIAQPQIGGSNYAPNGQLQSAFQKAPDMNAMFKKYHGSSYDPNSSRDRKLYQQLQQLQSAGKPVNAQTVYGRQYAR